MKRRLAAGLVIVFAVLSMTPLMAESADSDPHAGHQHQHVSQTNDAGFFDNLLKVYTPRRACMYYEQPVIWMHLLSDLLIAAAYYSIPFALVYFVSRRTDVAFGWMFWMFAAFICACGTTHLIGVADLWYPLYKIDGLVKMITAGLSIATAIAMWPLIPKALALPSPTQLEISVRERTAELAQTNDDLKQALIDRAQAQEAQGRLAAIVESSDDPIVGKTLDGIVTSWNAAAERLFGYSAAEMIGQPMTRIIPADRVEEEQEIARRLSAGERLRHFETVRLTRDGTRLDMSVASSPIKDGTGRIIGESIIARDIRSQKQIEQQKEKALDSERAARTQAERAARMKDEFLAIVSHELRTPINAVLGWAQLLREDSRDSESVTQGLEVIERNSRMQAQLIEELLDLSSIVAGKFRLDVQRVLPESFIKAAMDTVTPAADAKRITVRSVLDPHAGPITGDPRRLQQVMWNLLNNAIKFTNKEGKVEVLLQRINSHIEITVADTGEGIAEDFLPYVFDPFRQADPSVSRKHGGMGIGLSLVKSLVEMHGGTVSARSAGRGRGATFVINLPLRVVEVEAADLEHPRVDATSAPSRLRRADLSGTRVMLVDDEQDARDLVQRLLGDCGATVAVAASGQEALKLLQDSPVDVIISDIGMPGQDGYEFLKSLRGLGIQTPALALTAFARGEDRLRALHAGFQMHLAKPVGAAELIASVASLAGKIGRGDQPA